MSGRDEVCCPCCADYVAVKKDADFSTAVCDGCRLSFAVGRDIDGWQIEDTRSLIDPQVASMLLWCVEDALKFAAEAGVPVVAPRFDRWRQYVALAKSGGAE